jgi:hypothetical protein
MQDPLCLLLVVGLFLGLILSIAAFVGIVIEQIAFRR